MSLASNSITNLHVFSKLQSNASIALNLNKNPCTSIAPLQRSYGEGFQPLSLREIRLVPSLDFNQ